MNRRKAGRELEALVARFEQLMGPDVTVTSPATIRGKTSGAIREIDIALRGKIGSSDVLIIIECRKHKHVQDVTWIEQIASKVDDVGAALAIAVSSSGFSEAAARLAESRNIDLRTIDSIKPEQYKSHFQSVPVFRVVHRSRFIDVRLRLREHAVQLAKDFDQDFTRKLFDRRSRIYRWDGSEARISLYDVWYANAQKLFEAYHEIPKGTTVVWPIRYEINGALFFRCAVWVARG